MEVIFEVRTQFILLKRGSHGDFVATIPCISDNGPHNSLSNAHAGGMIDGPYQGFGTLFFTPCKLYRTFYDHAGSLASHADVYGVGTLTFSAVEKMASQASCSQFLESLTNLGTTRRLGLGGDERTETHTNRWNQGRRCCGGTPPSHGVAVHGYDRFAEYRLGCSFGRVKQEYNSRSRDEVLQKREMDLWVLLGGRRCGRPRLVYNATVVNKCSCQAGGQEPWGTPRVADNPGVRGESPRPRLLHPDARPGKSGVVAGQSGTSLEIRLREHP